MTKVFVGLSVILVVAISAIFWLSQLTMNRHDQVTLVASPTETTILPTATVSLTRLVTLSASLYYPMTSYSDRATARTYGMLVKSTDLVSPDCGHGFSGYHNGDDLETTAEERNTSVPVFAIAAGTVREVQTIGGYGGLIVTEHQLADQPVTAYYGHINLSQTSVKVGDQVKAGQQMSVLGDHCSTQTNGERKHLHFAIHSGKTVDVRGYVPTKTELQNWFDPRQKLSYLGAADPH